MMGHSGLSQHKGGMSMSTKVLGVSSFTGFADLTEVRLYDADDDNELPISHRK